MNTAAQTPERGFPRSEAAFAFCAALFVVTLVLTNVIGTKLFTVFGETLTTGIITYPITFLLTDVVSKSGAASEPMRW